MCALVQERWRQVVLVSAWLDLYARLLCRYRRVGRVGQVAAAYGGAYFSHIRGENDAVIEAVAEAIEIGRQAGAPVQIAHLKVMGEHMWGTSQQLLQMIENARQSGLDVTFDQYPYTASACGLSTVLPP